MSKKHSEVRTERVAMMLTPQEVRKLDDWGFSQRIRARSEVIRTLAMKQLEQEFQNGTES